MDMELLIFPQNNDLTVTARFPSIASGAGLQSQFWIKNNKTTPDNDPTSLSYDASIVPDPANAGATMAQFQIPSTNTATPGALWWRVDVIDINQKRRTANSGTLLVESV
jgi:hypothetical protein